ncbi:DEAD/DEAH box helicase [Rhizobacter sp. SG703]|uniref:DEAD/DEAH box helicase n=1 Tax=Rhizobacter sp. SG703 TaxID=2587140 RepID=UPI001446259D|nr:DEAD/DEAH box helicase [Rhizobacter sp. SG703]NKI95204.1 superfamily II DNA or RNA helicase [Rhizobacter sp. SG703]
MTEFFIPPEFDFGQQFDRVTLTRAMALQPEQALLAMQIDGQALLTRMRGSGAHVYEQRIELPIDRRLGLQVRGVCSCPVGLNCKHVAAALMAFEALELRRRKNPDLAPPHRLDPIPTPAARAAPVPTADDWPRPVRLWLAELADIAGRPVPPPSTASAPQRTLMYVLNARGGTLVLTLHLGSLRRTGELGSHRPHSPSVIDMLRNRPAYLVPADLEILAALLPLLGPNVNTGSLPMRGRDALAVVELILRSGRAWIVPPLLGELPHPPGAVARRIDEPLPVSLHWFADEMGDWHTQWRGPGDEPVVIVMLPEPQAIDLGGLTLRPAALQGVSPDAPVIDWLARMPPVPAELLSSFTERLQGIAVQRGVQLPVPDEQARALRNLGTLALVPVLRLGTCVDAASEAMLHQRFGTRASRPLVSDHAPRQASVQLLLRYRVPGMPPVDYHLPAGHAETTFLDATRVSGATTAQLTRFDRDADAESAAVRTMVDPLRLRPWSLAAGAAMQRQSSFGSGRIVSAGYGVALEGQPMIFVPQQRDQWPQLLTQEVPRLKEQGWLVEIDDDFPFELHEADDWTVDLQQDPGSEWFRLGLKLTVEGQPVNLVPLLVGLVQSGWLKVDSALRAGTGEVLVPWPGETPPSAPLPLGAPARQRLLRVPVQRIAPLLDWLRGVFEKPTMKAADASLQLSRFDLGTLDALTTGARVVAPPSLDALIRELRGLGNGNGLPPVEPSPNVHATLRHYQLDGLAWMDFLRRARLGGVLADDMGLGKTLQTLALLQGELDAGRLDKPSLVVVPTSLVDNWHTEAQRFTPQLKTLVLHGARRMQHFERLGQAQLVITSYPLAVRDIDVLAAQDWHYVVLDEAQRIKNSRSQAALALKGLRAQHRLCLSGTPLENHLGELWSLMDFVCPGLLGSELQFRERYRQPIEKRQDQLQAQHLARRVRPFILRRTKQQVAQELPAKTETLLRVELSGAQADLYETVRATMDEKLRDAIEKQGLARSQIMVLDALLKLRQVCCDPRLLKGDAREAQAAAGKAAPSAKLELLLDLLPTLVEDGRRVLLFSQFTEMLALIETELARLKLPYLILTGETDDRAGLVEQFQQGEVPLFLISLKAGGVGLNLTAADTVILYDPWWNPAVEQQAIDRAYRIGQDKPVFVYKLLASGTVEDKMIELQARKAGLADLLLKGVASDAALNAEDFDDLFKPLSDGAPKEGG